MIRDRLGGNIRNVLVAVAVGLLAAVLVGCPSASAGGGAGDGGGATTTYTVTYDANGATSGDPPTPETKTEGSELKLAANDNSLSRDGYTFAGWNTASDGSGTSYAEGATYSTDENLTLYAEWTALATYTVTYNANGADSRSTPDDQTKTEGTDLTLADNTDGLARDGVKFAGWNTASDGTGTSYAEGATYSTDANLTLYAEWADYEIGDPGPAGGLIFFDDEDDNSDDYGFRYLEAAPDSTEWSVWETKDWGGWGTDINGNDSTVAPELNGIGDGASNTAAIVAEFGNTEPYQGKSDYAAKLADDLEHNDYSDWFLPSRDELALMYQNLYRQGLGRFLANFYWSSSEYSSDYAWYQIFSSDFHQPYITYKEVNYGVRAVRAFGD